ncbi:fucose 4-O-acetylase-like acetyltransferase [Pseudomonas duriflava]|uniref:Fucose 4-O-acetylase-like acetyltransferase n=1 Tax=Pseudomonas duriflava TaxID=459528 RepID=A0A562QDP7_9PSED|nr:acyltransferase family protein [Pseudomonas duriflava]TWI54829.1 fucose 4-O-acetylase-like acetyltransferase [Pseudomonas duriflava]
MNSRNLWVDYAKAIGILLVVYGHVIRGLINAGVITVNIKTHMLIDSMIYAFHMPLFFFLSGLFFYKSLLSRDRKGVLFNKVDTIVYPYIVWSIIQGVTEVILARYTNGSATLGEVFSLLWQPRQQFWFLYILFLTFALSILLYGSKSKKVFTPVLLTSALIYVFQEYAPRQLLLDLTIQNFVYFAFGVWFVNIAAAIEAQPARVAVVTLLITAGLQYQFHIVSHHFYMERGLMTLLIAISAILFLVSLSMILARHPIQWFVTIGTLSMPIYLMHILAGSGIRVILSKFLHIDNVYIHIFGACLIGVMAPIIAAKLLTRWNMNFLFQAPTLNGLKRQHKSVPRETTHSVAS